MLRLPRRRLNGAIAVGRVLVGGRALLVGADAILLGVALQQLLMTILVQRFSQEEEAVLLNLACASKFGRFLLPQLCAAMVLIVAATLAAHGPPARPFTLSPRALVGCHLGLPALLLAALLVSGALPPGHCAKPALATLIVWIVPAILFEVTRVGVEGWHPAIRRSVIAEAHLHALVAAALV